MDRAPLENESDPVTRAHLPGSSLVVWRTTGRLQAQRGLERLARGPERRLVPRGHAEHRPIGETPFEPQLAARHGHGAEHVARDERGTRAERQPGASAPCESLL